MCGIFGIYTKKETEIFSKIHSGLERLEYRGYDSWGISWVEENQIKTYKTTDPLIKKPKIKTQAQMAIGHTRWATHGKVSETNAHPHYSNDFVLAQNGIVENFEKLKHQLSKYLTFTTQTDTEVIVKLIEKNLKKYKSKEKAVVNSFKKLRGRNTIIVLFENKIIAIKNGSPLTLGISENEIIFSSDTLSFSELTKKAVILKNNQMVSYNGEKLNFFDLNTNKKFKPKITTLNYKNSKISKEGHEHYMIKEIMEQKNAIVESTSYTKKELVKLVQLLKKSQNTYTIGAGTASYAAGQFAYYLRSISAITCLDILSYEADSYKNVLNQNSTLIALSQSGETADTIEALEIAKEKNTKIVSLVNMMGSTISKMSNLKFYLRVGPEIAVVSTKAFIGKISFGYLLAHTIKDNYKNAQKNLKLLSSLIEKFIKSEQLQKIKDLAKELKTKDSLYILGRGQNFYIAKEGALKLKETSYVQAEAFSAGELKHGVIALIENNITVIVIVSEDDQKKNVLNAVSEIKARGGKIVAIAKKDNKLFDYFIKVPNSNDLDAVLNVIPFQLLAYYIALEKNLNPDKPRNLAKSVTVK